MPARSPPPKSATIPRAVKEQSSSTLTWILAGALVLALLVIAFLLGRGSSPQVATTPPIETPDVDSLPPGERPIEPPPPEVAGERRTREPHIERGKDGILITNDAPSGARVEERGGEIHIVDDGSDASAVRAYFAQIDAIQAGPAGMSPDAYAQKLVADMSAGDRSGFDGLTSDLARSEKELAAISPPEPCAPYHQALLEAARTGREVMEELRGAMGTGDLGRVQALSARLQGLQATTTRLEQMRKELERRYGS
jgi:hypothetical protein